MTDIGFLKDEIDGIGDPDILKMVIKYCQNRLEALTGEEDPTNLSLNRGERKLARRHQLLNAIKEYRFRTDQGLKESKDAVEAFIHAPSEFESSIELKEFLEHFANKSANIGNWQSFYGIVNPLNHLVASKDKFPVIAPLVGDIEAFYNVSEKTDATFDLIRETIADFLHNPAYLKWVHSF